MSAFKAIAANALKAGPQKPAAGSKYKKATAICDISNVESIGISLSNGSCVKPRTKEQRVEKTKILTQKRQCPKFNFAFFVACARVLQKRNYPWPAIAESLRKYDNSLDVSAVKTALAPKKKKCSRIVKQRNINAAGGSAI